MLYINNSGTIVASPKDRTESLLFEAMVNSALNDVENIHGKEKRWLFFQLLESEISEAYDLEDSFKIGYNACKFAIKKLKADDSIEKLINCSNVGELLRTLDKMRNIEDVSFYGLYQIRVILSGDATIYFEFENTDILNYTVHI